MKESQSAALSVSVSICVAGGLSPVSGALWVKPWPETAPDLRAEGVCQCGLWALFSERAASRSRSCGPGSLTVPGLQRRR